MIHPFTIALLAVGLLAAGQARADDPAPLDAFSERCLEHGPNFERTKALAEDRQWSTLAADMSLTFVPLENPVAMEGWLLSSENQPFQALVIARAIVGEKPVESCTMAFSGIDAAAFEKDLVRQAGVKLSGDQKGQGRFRKFYTTEADGKKQAVTLDLPLYPNGSDDVLASIVSEQQIEN